MKKNSKPVPQVAETIGIDLGDKVSRYAVVNQQGEVVEEGNFRNQVSSIEKQFGNTGKARIALETGSQSGWISRELTRLGHEVIVANAREVKWITASDKKNDRVDAKKLALLARADVRLLAPVELRSAEQQVELTTVRARDAMVRARTLLVNAARGLAKAMGHRLPATVTTTFGVRSLLCLPPLLQDALKTLLEQIDDLGRRVCSLDQAVDRAAEKHPEVTPLTGIPGVGNLTALTFVLTLGRCDRFAHSRDAAAYVGLRPRQRQSGASDPQLRISKCGDSYLRKLLVQCAHHILGHFGKPSALREWGLALSGSKTATKKAVVAVARKLAVLLHRLWTTGESYKPFPKMA